jgi:hypothetical protein
MMLLSKPYQLFIAHPNDVTTLYLTQNRLEHTSINLGKTDRDEASFSYLCNL